jgi:hypothetical protein
VAPEEVAAFVVFPCSDSAKQITGANSSMDGGWTARGPFSRRGAPRGTSTPRRHETRREGRQTAAPLEALRSTRRLTSQAFDFRLMRKCSAALGEATEMQACGGRLAISRSCVNMTRSNIPAHALTYGLM